MGYSINIGECETYADQETGEFSIGVESKFLNEAPNYEGDPSEGTNNRMPSYLGWASFCEQVGIHDLMFAKNYLCFDKQNKTAIDMDSLPEDKERFICIQPLMDRHPKISGITKYHVAALEKAYQDRLNWATQKGKKAGAVFIGIHENEPHPDYDYNLVRLEWLCFWTKWALKNCEIPIFENS